MYIAWVSFFVNLFPSWFVGYVHCILRFGVLVNLLANWCLVGYSTVIWLSSSTLSKYICPLLSLNLFSPHYNPIKDLLIVLCTLHFSGVEFESLVKHMIVCIFGMSLEWTSDIFQTHEWECSIFPKSEVLPVHLALLNLMCLCDMLCSSLGVIKFDIELVELYFFENLLFLLILKCFVNYLGLPLIVILACDMLWFAYFKEVAPLHLP